MRGFSYIRNKGEKKKKKKKKKNKKGRRKMRSKKEFNNKSEALGKLIKEKRVELGISLEEIAFVVDVSREYFRRVELGIVKSPGVENIVKIFYVLGLNIEKLNEIFLSKIDKKNLEEFEVLEKFGKLTYSERKALLPHLIKQSLIK